MNAWAKVGVIVAAAFLGGLSTLQGASPPVGPIASVDPHADVLRAATPRDLARTGRLAAVQLISYRTRSSTNETTAQETLEAESELTADENPSEEESAGGSSDEGDEATESTVLGTAWHQAGPITTEYLYTGEVFNNSRGGISTQQATRYRGNFDLTLTLDTAAANWWEGGEVFVYLQQSHGRTLTPDFVGDGQFYSNIDTGADQDVTQLAEYWYQHALSEEHTVKLGRQDANENFAFADLGGDFVNSSFVTLANIPLPTWPYQTLGVSSLYQPNKRWRFGGGIYDHGEDVGQWWITTASRGMFLIGQADYQPCAECTDALLTLLRLGAWFTNSDTLAVDDSGTHENNYGFYGTLDRLLLPEYDDLEQGLGAFGQLSWAPGDRNQVDWNYGAGLVYRGLLPNRDDDTAGVGFSVIEFSSDLSNVTGQISENAIEAFYKARIRPGLAIQPDVQYIVSPSGIERDALLVGLRFEANL